MRWMVVSSALSEVEKYTSDFSNPSILMSSSLRMDLRSSRSFSRNWRFTDRRSIW